MQPDEIDICILRALRKNARVSLKELSTTVNLSSPATGERLRKLERDGFIKDYAAILDAKKFNKEFTCYCMVELSRHTPEIDHSFENFALESKEILECRRITGNYEYILKIVAGSPKDVDHLIETMRSTKSVIATKTYTVLKDVKEEYSAYPD
jgi:DNA-binding Lrp family transcriptional regulator